MPIYTRPYTILCGYACPCGLRASKKRSDHCSHSHCH